MRPSAASDEQECRRLWTAYLDQYETAVTGGYQTTCSRLHSQGEFEPNGFIEEAVCR
ncbi:hypothetical protein [Mesorhizobium sp. M0088]|uniref:hypothetical protein n=1 Tax=Mesorhizobium sp. M0088 TaxID=2956873 RepID=UPI00333CDD5D